MNWGRGKKKRNGIIKCSGERKAILKLLIWAKMTSLWLGHMKINCCRKITKNTYMPTTSMLKG